MTAYIAATQEQLGAIISTPKLTDKLLSKPPFRFLHDIVTSFMRTTNFPEGLYTEDMLDSSKVTDKESKLTFLGKLIAVVEAATGKSCAAKPIKIVAGHEPENTNELLQLLASCAALSPEQKKAAVLKVNGGSATAATAEAGMPPAKAKEKTKEGDDAAAAADARRAAKEERRRREKEAAAKNAAATPAEEPRRRHEERPPERTSDANEDRRAPDESRKAKSKEEERRRRHDERKREADREERHSLRSTTAVAEQPTTAGKPPPRVKPTHEVMSAQNAADSAPAAGVIREAKRGEANNSSEPEAAGEDDWMKIVERQEARASGATAAVADDAEVKGLLGQQALKARREQEEAARAAEDTTLSGAPRDGGIVIRGARGTSKGLGNTIGDGELTKLREQLQMITRASNPLGKFLEAIHDDIDTMTRELAMWRSESRNQALAAAEANRQTEESLQEVHAQLQNLEDAINDQVLKTNNLRQTIIANDTAIEGMIRMVVNPEVGGAL